MKRHSPTEPGIAFTIFVAAATFVIAVVAGIFLIYQSDATVSYNAQLRGLAQVQTSPVPGGPPPISE